VSALVPASGGEDGATLASRSFPSLVENEEKKNNLSILHVRTVFRFSLQ